MRDDKEFYDRVYEAYMCGRNPDMVDRDEWDHLRSQGCQPEEISYRDLMPRPEPKPEEDQ